MGEGGAGQLFGGWQQNLSGLPLFRLKMDLRSLSQPSAETVRPE